MFNLLYLVAALVTGAIIGVIIGKIYQASLKQKASSIDKERDAILEEAKRTALAITKESTIEAKEVVLQAKTEVERDLKERKQEVTQQERRLRQKEETLEKKYDQLEQRESDLNKKERDFSNRDKQLVDKENRLKQLVTEQTVLLERLSQYTTEEAKVELFKRIEEDSKYDAVKLAKRIEDEARETAVKKANEIISLAVQRYASEYISDATVTSVTLPNDEMKGRIIGREGRNIRALEAATGVDFIVDDTPGMVTLSCFDPVRREVARLALEKLISDGRIHPARIEEIVVKIGKDVDATILEEGEKAVFDLGLAGIHPEIIRLLGRLKYRTSYGQNVLQHSREVAYLAGIMAGELNVDSKLARRAGLLHDIGKAIDHEVEGSHQDIGSKFAKKHGENEKVVNAILVHHGEGEPATVEAALVAAADALSAARPGVRSESIENYLRRLEKLEQLSLSYKGVEKCYAIQAGREVRLIVKPEELSDEATWTIAKDLAKRIEAEMTYPGQIRVTVIRESRFVEYAK